MTPGERHIKAEIEERKKLIEFYEKRILQKKLLKHVYKIQIRRHRKEIRELEKLLKSET